MNEKVRLSNDLRELVKKAVEEHGREKFVRAAMQASTEHSLFAWLNRASAQQTFNKFLNHGMSAGWASLKAYDYALRSIYPFAAPTATQVEIHAKWMPASKKKWAKMQVSSLAVKASPQEVTVEPPPPVQVTEALEVLVSLSDEDALAQISLALDATDLPKSRQFRILSLVAEAFEEGRA